MRPVVLHPKARDTIRTWPREIRERFGMALYLRQAGERPGMPLVRLMPSVAPGVSELRLHDENGQFRVFHFAVNAQGILVFHAFRKKTRRTAPTEIETGRRRLKEMLDEQD